MAFGISSTAGYRNSTDTGESTSKLAVKVPPDVADGDMVITFIICDDNPGAYTLPPGWTQFPCTSNGSFISQVWYLPSATTDDVGVHRSSVVANPVHWTANTWCVSGTDGLGPVSSDDWVYTNAGGGLGGNAFPDPGSTGYTFYLLVCASIGGGTTGSASSTNNTAYDSGTISNGATDWSGGVVALFFGALGDAPASDYACTTFPELHTQLYERHAFYVGAGGPVDPKPAASANELPLRLRKVDVRELPWTISTSQVRGD